MNFLDSPDSSQLRQPLFNLLINERLKQVRIFDIFGKRYCFRNAETSIYVVAQAA